MNRHPAQLRPALLRMVTDGLHLTIDSYLAGTLPLHRLAWELRVRLETLAELTDLRTVNRLHAHTATVEHLRDRLATPDGTSPAGPTMRPDELTRDNHTLLTSALAALRATLNALTHTPTPTPTHSRRPTTAA